ncbi:MAG: metal-binding protein [Oscillatoria sp. PMC 1068.18]|nr:metal-binding protein [Oscillatoria sp. PMC 1076.18]MEC4991772.1 metal-binding protein [Oscillatoria sp. PMC 1068.18]
MPSGRTHDRITLWTLPWVVAGSFLLTRSGELTLITAGAFLFSGLMFGPDLDIISIQFKRWGWLRFIWIPYQKSLRHRSVLSHGLIIGTLLRVVYLLVLVMGVGMFVVAIAQLIWGFPWNWQKFALNAVIFVVYYLNEAIALFLGLEIGAMSHSLSDWTGSAYKRYQKKGWQAIFPKPKRKSSRRRRK